MHRFYIEKAAFHGDYVVCRDKVIINQLIKVLRAKEGERFIVFEGSGFEYVSQLIDLKKEEARFLIIDRHLGRRELKNKIVLYQSLLKGEKMDLLVQKATELGVSLFIPVISARSIVRGITPAKQKRYSEIIKEATEQCGGSKLMELAPAIGFPEAVKLAEESAGHKYIAFEKEMKNTPNINAEEVHLFVGPEGGYEDIEVSLASRSGILPVSLGLRILRAETATIYFISQFV